VNEERCSTRIVLYSLIYADRLLEEVPYVRYLWERSLCHLEDLRREDTNLIIITPVPVEPYTLEYHYRDSIGSMIDRCNRQIRG
jgi:L-propargylglycine--L-glutamate ligase